MSIKNSHHQSHKTIHYNYINQQQCKINFPQNACAQKIDAQKNKYIVLSPENFNEQSYCKQGLEHTLNKVITAPLRVKRVSISGDVNFASHNIRQRSKSPKIHSIQTKNIGHTDPNLKVRVLQKRIIQLHQIHQIEKNILLDQIKSLQQNLQNYRQKINQFVYQDSRFIQNKHNHKLDKLINEIKTKNKDTLQKQIIKYRQQPKIIRTQDINLYQQMGTLIKILLSEQQLQISEKSKQLIQVSSNGLAQVNNVYQIQSIKVQNDQLKSKIRKLSEQINHLKDQIKMKAAFIVQIKQKVRFYVQRAQLQQKEINNLREYGQKTRVEYENLRKQLDDKQKYKYISFKYGQSISINLQQMKKQKLKAISFKQSILIDQNQQIMKDNEDFNQDSLVNLIEKMSLLTNTNDKIILQNQQLNKKISQLIHQKQLLKNTIQLAYQAVHNKQVLVISKQEQNNILKRNIQQLELKQKNLIQQKLLKQKSIENQCLQVISCQRCGQLFKLLSNLKNKTRSVKNHQV